MQDLDAVRLNRATLARQHLLERTDRSVEDVVGHLVGLQGQEPPSPYVALWNRIAGFDPAELDRAYATGAVVTASLFRITLHSVTRTDQPTFHAAMVSSLRASRLNDRRFTSTGLTTEAMDEVLDDFLAFMAEPRDKEAAERFLADRLGDEPRAWWALRTYAPLVRVPTGGPWSFPRLPLYRSGPDPIPMERPDALAEVVARYLTAFGPASIADIGQFTLLSRVDLRTAADALHLQVYRGPDGRDLLDVPGSGLPDADVEVPPRLLGMWDNVLLAYADRSRIIPEPHRAHVIRRNGDVLPTVLVDGYVAGVWRLTDDGVEVAAFERLPDATWSALAEEAAGLRDFLVSRDPTAFSGRVASWWDKLPRPSEVHTFS